MAYIQGISNDSAPTTSLQLTLTQATAAGSLLVVVAANDGGTAGTVSDSAGGTWTAVGSAQNLSGAAQANLQIYYRQNAGSGVTWVKYTTSAAQYMGVTFSEHSGIATSGALQAAPHGSQTNTYSTTETTAAFTPNANDLMICAYVNDGAAGTASPTSPWLDGANSTSHELTKFSAGNFDISQEYQYFGASPGSTSGSWAVSVAATPNDGATCWAAFAKAAGGAADPFPAGYGHSYRSMSNILSRL